MLRKVFVHFFNELGIVGTVKLVKRVRRRVAIRQAFFLAAEMGERAAADRRPA